MSDDDNRGPDSALRERIVRLMQANGAVPRKPIGEEEQRKLKSAASRLDQMLKSAADAESQALSNAAARLGQMLVDMSKGKDIGGRIRRREQKK